VPGIRDPYVSRNIGGAGRRMRALIGGAVLLGTLFALGMLVSAGAPAPVRIGLFPGFLIGMLGLVQARAGVCVALAARGLQEHDDGPQPITDAYARATVRTAARSVWWRAGAAALVATALALLL
jgi:hypothetical protein